MKLKDVPSLILSIAVCQAAGFVGSIFTFPAIPTWYASIVKSPLNPPSWVFGPVWTTLFTLMGIALWLVLTKKPFRKREAYMAAGVFAVQLILNALWSYVFFGLQDPRAAFFELLALWLAIAATIIVFYRIRKSAAILLIPYLLWVSFAGFLTYSVWQLNRVPAGESRPPIGTALPDGYSRNDYVIEKVTGESCRKSEECETPFEYMAMSRCPFTSVCIEGSCAVVCPNPGR
jgi:translocator protein